MASRRKGKRGRKAAAEVEEPPENEEDSIEHLLQHVKTTSGTTALRCGTEMTPPTTPCRPPLLVRTVPFILGLTSATSPPLQRTGKASQAGS